MRVLLVTDALPPTPRGGLDLHVLELRDALSAAGHDVEVAALAGDAHDAVGTGGPPGSRLRRSFAQGARCGQLVERMDDFAPDVVHFHSLQGLHYALPTIARRRGARVVWTQHDFFALCQRVHLVDGRGAACIGPRKGVACGKCFGGLAGLLGVPLFPLRTSAMLRALRACHAVVAPSEFSRLTLEAHGVDPDRLVLLPPGVPRPPRDAQPPAPGSPPRFVYAGDLRFAKGADLAIEAAAALDQDVMLEVLGGAPAAPAGKEAVFEAGLRRAAADAHVHFSGRYEPDELLAALDGATALLVPSRVRETFGRTANLALQAGVPVIAADHGALPESVVEGINGALFDPSDPDSLAAAMGRVLSLGGALRAARPAWPIPPDLDAHLDGLLVVYRGAA